MNKIKNKIIITLRKFYNSLDPWSGLTTAF